VHLPDFRTDLFAPAGNEFFWRVMPPCSLFAIMVPLAICAKLKS
jgi:hypothetical protein